MRFVMILGFLLASASCSVSEYSNNKGLSEEKIRQDIREVLEVFQAGALDTEDEFENRRMIYRIDSMLKTTFDYLTRRIRASVKPWIQIRTDVDISISTILSEVRELSETIEFIISPGSVHGGKFLGSTILDRVEVVFSGFTGSTGSDRVQRLIRLWSMVRLWQDISIDKVPLFECSLDTGYPKGFTLSGVGIDIAQLRHAAEMIPISSKNEIVRLLARSIRWVEDLKKSIGMAPNHAEGHEMYTWISYESTHPAELGLWPYLSRPPTTSAADEIISMIDDIFAVPDFTQGLMNRFVERSARDLYYLSLSRLEDLFEQLAIESYFQGITVPPESRARVLTFIDQVSFIRISDQLRVTEMSRDAIRLLLDKVGKIMHGMWQKCIREKCSGCEFILIGDSNFSLHVFRHLSPIERMASLNERLEVVVQILHRPYLSTREARVFERELTWLNDALSQILNSAGEGFFPPVLSKRPEGYFSRT